MFVGEKIPVLGDWPALSGSHMRCGRAMTGFATDAGNQALKPKLLRLTDRVCGMTGETLSSVCGRQLLSQRGFQRWRLHPGRSQSEVQPFDRRIETDTAFIKGSIVSGADKSARFRRDRNSS